MAALVAQGCGNKAIAKALHLTPGTVAGYVASILKKTNLPNRTALAVAWVRKEIQ